MSETQSKRRTCDEAQKGGGAMAVSADSPETDSTPRSGERPAWMMPGVVAVLACSFGVVLSDNALGELWLEAGLGAGVLGVVTAAANGLLFKGALNGDAGPAFGLRTWFVRTALVLVCVLLGISRGGAALHLRAADDLASGLGAGGGDGPGTNAQRVLTVRGIVEDAELGGPGTGSGGPNPWQADNSGAFRAADHGTVVLRLSHAGSAGGDGAGVAAGAAAGMDQRGMQPVTGRMKLALPPGMNVKVGEGIEATGLLLPRRGDGVPGQSHAERKARAQGVAGTLVCRDAALLKRTELNGVIMHAEGRVRAGLAVMRSGAKGLLGLDADGGGAGVAGTAEEAGGTSRRAETDAFIAALLLGEYQPAIRETADRFARLGLLHALSISGFHIAVLAVVAGLVLRALGVLGRANRLVLVLVVLGYVAMLPAAAPITRSAMTMGVAALVMTFGRQYNQLNLLGFIGAALALANPVDVFTPGFALTFLATGALLRLSGPAAALAQRIGWMNNDAAVELRGAVATDWTPWPLVLGAARGITAAALIGGVIWLLTAPTILVFSGWLSVLGVLVSLALAPLISLVLVLALLGLLVGGVVQGGAWLIGAAGVRAVWSMEPARAVAELTLALSRAADEIPGVALLLPPFGGDVLMGTALAGWAPVLWAAAATASVWVVLECALIGCVAGADRDNAREGGRRVPLGAAGAVLMAAAALGLLLMRGDVAAAGRGRVDKLELGAGTATLVRGALADGSAGVLLIDPGARGPNSCGAAAGAIRRAVRAVGCGQTPTVLLTGATVQKAGAVAELAAALGVRRVLLSAAVGEFVELSPNRPLSQVMRELRARGVEVVAMRPGETLVFGDVEVSESAGVAAGD